MLPRRLVFCLVAVLCGRVMLAAQQTAGEPLSLQAALDRAAAANPSLVAARLQEAVARASVDVAGEHLNPEARFEASRDTPRESFSLAFPLEIGDKRGRRVAVGEAGVRATEAEIGVATLDVRSAVRRAYFNRLIAGERLRLQGELEGVATRARDAARDRFEAGSVPRLDLLQAELALAQAVNDRRAAESAAEAARIQLDVLLALPLDAAPQLTTPLEAGQLPAPAVAIQQAQSVNPDLVAMDRRIDEAAARVELARANRVPDVTPEVGVTHGAEPEFTTGWRAAVTMAVPIFTRHTAAVHVESSVVTALRAERAAATARILGDVTAAMTTASARRAQYLEYRDTILPKAQDVERMAEDAYRLGQTPLASLLQALQASRDVRLRALDAASDYQNAFTDLERAIGAPLP